jgi:cytochrome c oxidase subunit 2
MLTACLFILCAILVFVGIQPAMAALPDSFWYYNLLPAISPGKLRIEHFHHLLMIIVTGITIVVIALLIYAMIRFRRKANPVPSTRTHHVKLEIIWTLIPCLLLVIIMWFSFPLMYYMDKTKQPGVTLKVTGYQWYWGYAYPDLEIEEFTNYYIPGKDQDAKNEFEALRAMPTYQRLLSTYDLTTGQPSFVVLPVETDVRILTTAADVLHSWAMPMAGVKKDAVPGRINETWLRINTPGIYYGQCSEICGTNHGFMPIEIRAVPMEQFKQWAEMMKTDSAKAMAMIQSETLQYAQAPIVAPHLTLSTVWSSMTNGLKQAGSH